MDNNYFDKYPELKQLFENMRVSRCYEILENLSKNDKVYTNHIKNRAEQSMILRNRLGDNLIEFEKYMDFVCEQEIYELDAIYVHGFHDAISALIDLKLLP